MSNLLILTTEIVLVSLVLSSPFNPTIVNLPNGKIQGKFVNFNEINFYAFLQIPYAQPPIGNLRFKPPKPVQNWSGILNCTKNERYCYQVPSNSKMENEDCLYLNVYTPVKPGTPADLPVLFFIHGGGFVEGQGGFDEYPPHFFMDKNIVLVSVNYRLGPFGFLSTGDEVILGNNGLKDQNLALKWVNNNIAQFGGDPSKITIFGQSAGAASVTYQILSKKSSGLFRAAIAESGSALCPWAYQRNSRKIAFQLAKFVDENFDENSSSQELLEFFQNINATDLDSASNKFVEGPKNEQVVQGYFFAPTVEPETDDAFITAKMYEAASRGDFNKVPLLTGICSEETVWKAILSISFQLNLRNYERDMATFVPDDMNIPEYFTKNELGQKIRSFYTDNEFFNDIPAAVKYFSDTSFNRGVRKYAELHSKFADVFFYQFSYKGNLGYNFISINGTDQVSHGEDARYLWAVDKDISKYPANDILTQQRYLTIFTEFTKYLDPTAQQLAILDNISWPKVNGHDVFYLNINDTLKIEENPKGVTYEKWNALYDENGIRPFDTY